MIPHVSSALGFFQHGFTYTLLKWSENTFNRLNPESASTEFVLSLFAFGLKICDSTSISIIPYFDKFSILVCLKSWLSLCIKLTCSMVHNWVSHEVKTLWWRKHCFEQNFCFFVIFCFVGLLTVGLCTTLAALLPSLFLLFLPGMVCPTWNTWHTWMRTIGKRKESNFCTNDIWK